MFQNFWVKFLVYVVFYLVSSLLMFYFFEIPFLFETVLAEELAADTADKKVESPVAESQQKTSKSYGDILWEYRWYLLGASLVIISSVVLVVYLSSGSTPPPLLMPHVPGQTITDLIAIKPNVCIDPLFSKAMPEVFSVDSNFFNADRTAVVDPNFIRGFRVGEDFYQVWLMPANTPYAEISQNFWIAEAQTQLGKVTFPSPDVTFLYTQVAVIPLDAVNYTVYHKVDIVQIIQDPGHQAIPRILTSYLFKDNEYGWVQ